MSQPQTRENARDYDLLIYVLRLIGSGDGTSFPDQSKSEVKQIKHAQAQITSGDKNRQAHEYINR